MTPANIEDLTPAELEALRSAGAWYAKLRRRSRRRAGRRPFRVRRAEAREVLTLVGALRKLGFEMAIPDALRSPERTAA